MKQQMLYNELAKYYDFIYHWKDYKKESKKIRAWISKYKKSEGKELLDVACGTGNHLQTLKNRFNCIGIDLNKEMLDVARKNVKGVFFKQANMVNFRLNKKFDVVLCLFSSIGYVKTYKNLAKTIKNFSNHLKTGGVLIVEPWIKKSSFKIGHIHLDSSSSDNLKIARMGISRIKGNISILEMHYLIGGHDVKYLSDVHELGLFDQDKTLKIINDSGLSIVHLKTATYNKGGIEKDRGIFVAVKK